MGVGRPFVAQHGNAVEQHRPTLSDSSGSSWRCENASQLLLLAGAAAIGAGAAALSSSPFNSPTGPWLCRVRRRVRAPPQGSEKGQADQLQQWTAGDTGGGLVCEGHLNAFMSAVLTILPGP